MEATLFTDLAEGKVHSTQPQSMDLHSPKAHWTPRAESSPVWVLSRLEAGTTRKTQGVYYGTSSLAEKIAQWPWLQGAVCCGRNIGFDDITG